MPSNDEPVHFAASRPNREVAVRYQIADAESRQQIRRNPLTSGDAGRHPSFPRQPRLDGLSQGQ